VTKQNCDFFDRSASQKQFNRESIAKPMRVTVLNSCQFEKISETALPNAHGGVQLRFSGPEEMVVAQSRNSVQNRDDMIGQRTTNWLASLLGGDIEVGPLKLVDSAPHGVSDSEA
jgi:hypothetical protein